MRTAAYCFVGYLIVSSGLSGLWIGGPEGVLTAALAAAALAWLVRSYRRGPRPAGPFAYDARRGAERLARRADELAARLPEDPLEHDGFVALSYGLRADPAAQARAEAEYARRHRRLARLGKQLAALEADADDTASPVLVDEERRLASELHELVRYADELDERAAEAADAVV
jgi:hypothetical protein